MTDRPILFSAPMVRALLEGRKTQTRRTLKPLPNRTIFFNPQIAGKEQFQKPRYAVGDRLWVREAWWIATCYSYGSTPGGDEVSPAPLAYRRSDPIHCAADGNPPNCANKHYGPNGLRPGSGAFAAPDPYAVWIKKSSIHMPRWASRLTLIVADVRVQRLQDISKADAIAEGVEKDSDGWRDYMLPQTRCCVSPTGSFQTLWNHINGPDSWNANPWVAAYTFRPILGNIDQIARAA